ncbi:MAG: DNA-3-methyladenine glycosylase [Selenomonadaceae bacterium]|nr:DNA-3-methyladenine glycosylase [Selenomonadaceae bacterium]
MKCNREFYLRSGLEVARDLIGKKLVHNSPEGLTSGIIVETEAYMGAIDAAAHSYKGLTERTKIQYGLGGYVYVYLIYGMYVCMNVVANIEEIPECVLIRALQPLDGVDLMKIRRKKNNLRDLCSGPGKLTQAMGITKNHYGIDLCGDEIFIEEVENFIPNITATKRINVDYAGDAANYLWRFILTDSEFISGTKLLNLNFEGDK